MSSSAAGASCVSRAEASDKAKPATGIPPEVISALENLHKCLGESETLFEPLVNESVTVLRNSLGALERAKLDLMAAYAWNSLYWVYLCTKGENPADSNLAAELDRIKKYMGRVKIIESRYANPGLNKPVAKRFMRNAMFDTAVAATNSAAQQRLGEEEQSTSSKKHGGLKYRTKSDKDRSSGAEHSEKKRRKSDVGGRETGKRRSDGGGSGGQRKRPKNR